VTIRNYRKKPQQPRSDDGIMAALYVPGEPLDDLRKVAAEAYNGEAAECALPSGPVVLAAWDDIQDRGTSRDHAVVPAGHWLTYSHSYGSLTSSSEAELDRWYEPA
jgi:hypothetical protein